MMSRVTVHEPEQMNLLGLILASVLERNLADAALQRRAARLSGEVVVQAGRMEITLAFEGGQVSVRRGAAVRPRARVSGSLSALMGLSLGHGMVAPVLSGRIKIKGNPLVLLRLKPLLRAQAAPPSAKTRS